MHVKCQRKKSKGQMRLRERDGDIVGKDAMDLINVGIKLESVIGWLFIASLTYAKIIKHFFLKWLLRIFLFALMIFLLWSGLNLYHTCKFRKLLFFQTRTCV
jgi:hypothetical protein